MAVIMTGNNKIEAHIKANAVLRCVYIHMKANQLHINMSKCCYMYFKPNKNFQDDQNSNPSLEHCGVPIKCVESTRFLGVVIDNKLSWIPHISYLTKKLNSQSGIINNIISNIPEKLHKDLYYTLFESHLSYCISVWGGVTSAKLEPIFVAQKRCLRIMFGDKTNFLDKFLTCARSRPYGKQHLGIEFFVKEHTKPIFTKLQIMTVHNLYTYRCYCELLKILKFRLPISLYSLFKLSKRNETLLLTEIPSIHFVYKSSLIWNFLRQKLEIFDFSVNINLSKSKLKTLILSNQEKYDLIEWIDHNYNIMKT